MWSNVTIYSRKSERVIIKIKRESMGFRRRKRRFIKKTGTIKRIIRKFRKKVFVKKVKRVIDKKMNLNYGDTLLTTANYTPWDPINFAAAPIGVQNVDLIELFITNVT